MTKKELRKKAIELRDSIEPEMAAQLSNIIQDRVINHPWFKESMTVFVYVSARSEVKTSGIIKKALESGKKVCVPRVIPRVRMEAVPVADLKEDLQMGYFNIMEPKPHLQPVEEVPDLVIVPGLLFDRKGFRLGYGGGYYDKYLTRLKPDSRTIGIAYSLQITDELPVEEHDIRVMTVITDSEIIVSKEISVG